MTRWLLETLLLLAVAGSLTLAWSRYGDSAPLPTAVACRVWECPEQFTWLL